jgi:tetratricopeptide (TPR) repeat protein
MKHRINEMLNKLIRHSLLLAILATPALLRADTIGRVEGPPLNGDVAEMSPLEVKVKVGSAEKVVPVNEIDYISWSGEPAQLKTMRTRVKSGDYEFVIDTADKIKPEDLKRKEMQQDVDYFRALAKARLALAGGGDIKEAGIMMRDFVKKNEGSYHLLKAAETLGDLFVAVGQYDLATAEYAKLEKAPWPDVQARAAIAKGRALLAQKKYPEAQAEFEKVLANPPAENTPAVKTQLQSATLGKATCLAATAQFEEGIKLIEGVIAEADPEDAELHARAYVTLGNCYRQKPGATKEALLAYLHVDVLYASQAEAHAEALSNLRQLWNEVGKPDRAQQAAEMLADRYKNSPWAKN